MSSNRGRFLASSFLVLVVGSSALAQRNDDIPLRSWTVPPYRGTASGYSTMTDVTSGVVFVGVAPCRLLDTRNNLNPLGGGGPYAVNEIRNYALPPNCGLPFGVDAVSLNVTATNTTASPFGHIKVWPHGTPEPNVSTLNWTTSGQTVANAAIVPPSPDGVLSVKSGNAGADVILDVNGYFAHSLNGNRALIITNVPNESALHVDNQSVANGSRAILGIASGTTGVTYGVLGETNSNASGAAGVRGVAPGTSGALGISKSQGVFGSRLGEGGAEVASGILRSNNSNAAGFYYGVFGGANAAAGVRGESNGGGFGVVGLTQGGTAGVYGASVTSGGSQVSAGYLGAGSLGVLSSGNAHVAGTFTATTNKGFVQPHPHDASKEIRYISLEGPHTEVYFRGTAQVSQGVTRIPIPQHFRFVADPATYSTLVTPVGGMATVAVLSEGPDGITVQASRNVKVHYVVYAEREAVRNPDPIIENVHFRSDPELDFLAHLPDTFRQLMIQNGTLKPDGTINMETARRLGWDKEWEMRRQPATQPE